MDLYTKNEIEEMCTNIDGTEEGELNITKPSRSRIKELKGIESESIWFIHVDIISKLREWGIEL